MDKLSRFLVETFQPAQPQVALTVPIAEPTFLEKRAYGMAVGGGGSDTEFLKQFEGTPLAPQAVALAEQELAMEQQQLQKRMQRSAERKMDDTWDQDCIQQDGIRLQKQQLLLQLYKMKAMTPAPQPGDAVIGTPPPAAAPQLGSEIGGGVEGNAPVAEQAPKLAAFVRNFMKKAAGPMDAAQERLMTLPGPNKHFARSVSPSGSVKTSSDIDHVLHIPHGADVDDELHEKLVNFGGHPGVPHEARKAILESYLQHRAQGGTHPPESLIRGRKSSQQAMGGVTGFGLGGLAGAGLGAGLGHMVNKNMGLELGLLGGGLAGMVGGSMLGHHLGGKGTPMSPEEAQGHIAAAKSHAATYAPLLNDEHAKEKLLHGLTIQHFQRKLDEANARHGGDADDDDDDWDLGRKKAAISKFARRMKQANAVTSAEQGLASLVAHRPPPMPGLAAAAEGIASRAKGAVPISSLRGAVPPPIPKTMPSGAPVLHRMAPQTSGGMAMKAKREAELAAVEAKLLRDAA